jgi:hypothetical protein
VGARSDCVLTVTVKTRNQKRRISQSTLDTPLTASCRKSVELKRFWDFSEDRQGRRVGAPAGVENRLSAPAGVENDSTAPAGVENDC